ncbi:non-canonical purine NTP pyrophosphatase [Synergistales bacterium]|nr:non-canonical purine NTP pyrophosphatase [Synergistales bacterium]
MSGLPIVLASGNKGKYAEFAAFFGSLGELSCFSLLCPDELRIAPPDPEETGESYEENALIKARAWTNTFGLPAFADDSGLEVRALSMKPGIHSARIADGSDADRVSWLLDKLNGVTDRRACFVASIVIAFPRGVNLGERDYFAARGRCRGVIADEPRGFNGFGYDPVFIPDGYTETFAELGGDVKSKISHRAIAMNGVAKMAGCVVKYSGYGI